MFGINRESHSTNYWCSQASDALGQTHTKLQPNPVEIWYNRKMNLKMQRKAHNGWHYRANSVLDVDPIAMDGLSVHRSRPRNVKVVNLHDELPPCARGERLKDGNMSEFRGMWQFLTSNYQHVVDDAGPLFEHEGAPSNYRTMSQMNIQEPFSDT